MTSLGEEPVRPEFESVDLAIEVDEIHRHIEEAIKGLSTSETEEGVRYRTTDGMLVAIVGSRGTEPGDVKATLVYRTEPALESATRKASKILDALKPHTVDR